MPEIKPVGAGEWVRMMLYAYPGWRKTSFLATGPPAGIKTLLIRSPMDQVPARALKSGLEEVVVSTWEDMMGGDGILDYLRMSDHGYEWVWIDCWSIIQDVLLDDIWAAVVAQNEHRAVLTPQGGMDKGEYGRNMERIQQFVRHIVGANSFHVGMTAHPFEHNHPTNDEGGTLLVPYIQGKNMTPKICGYCNIVAFQEIKVNEEKELTWSRMHFKENDRFYAKDLYDAFPKGYADNLTMPDLMKAIEAAKKNRPTDTSTTKRRPGRRGTRPASPTPRPGRRKKGAVS